VICTHIRIVREVDCWFCLDLGLLLLCFFASLFLCCLLCCVRFSFLSTEPRDWRGRTSLKWPVLSQVRRKNLTQLEMWANAQRDGRPAEYRWRPLFNATKFGWRPLLECREVTLPRRKTRWNSQGCPKLANGSQPLVGRSSLYYQDMWRRYCCLTSLSSEDIARQSCAMVPKWRFFCVLYFQRASCDTFQTCILNLH